MPPDPAARSTAAPTPAAAFNAGRSLVKGSAWMIGMRWGLRGLGLINTFILARLLAPADFGLVAMAMLVIGLVEMLGQTGQPLALIRHPNPTPAHYDAAWTLTIMIAVVLTLVLWGVAPYAPLYFHEPRSTRMIDLLALRTLIGGFENIGVVAFRKDLRFDREFTFQMLQRVATIVATVACALWWRDWRALAAGLLLGRALSVALSYAMHPYRPRFAVAKIPEMLSFSSWMLVVHVAQYMHNKADELVVGAVGDANALGRYDVAADSATAPTIEIVLPITRALFPVFARISHDTDAVRTAYLDLFGATCTICMAVGTGMALVADDFVAVALGPQWLQTVPLVRILAIAGGLYGIMQNAIPVLNATGHARLSAMLTTSRAVLITLAMAIAGMLGTVETIAITRAVMTLAFIPGVFLAISRVLPITIGDMLSRAWPPLVATLAMTAAVLAAHAVTPALPWVRLFTDAAAGAAVYGAAIVVLWVLGGRPAGAVAAAIARAAKLPGLRRLLPVVQPDAP